MREFFLQWELGYNSPVLFDLSEKKMPIVRIIHSATKYAGGVYIGGPPCRGGIRIFSKHTERRELTPVMIHPGNPTTTHMETMSPKDDKETWGY